MNQTTRQQIVIAGVGGQGVLFVTRLLAEAAIRRGLPVLTSETHGMAQRGGSVVSHLKIGGFASPLIRTGAADGLLGLKAESLDHFGRFLKPGAWVRLNGPAIGIESPRSRRVDAETLAAGLGNPRAVNLILLGFSLGVAEGDPEPGLFCTEKEIQEALTDSLGRAPDLLEASRAALEAGLSAGRRGGKTRTV